ncbi:RNA polymerase sigma factor [Sphingobacterium multivorum]|uniref:RNA polymerase sigma factor n=1 Tax=Sphingobacterium multivorum TaxID=28454 RepID=UPI000E8B594C|nr:sigma-70 family RNA polymerase sigma factor [Sphingobacterium multivorum]HAE68875.1 sigma-70 family RNA polymerase sigma factor [Sphingobacterium sp.]HBI90340.1 sigma-70 family RNA polymerase sigma factor [Sphingobacterium sp.]
MDEDPFEILVNEPDRGLKLIMAKHGSQLKKRIRNVVNNDDELVKDVISETLTVLFVEREKIALRKEPFVWMMVIAKNISLKMLRQEKRDRKVPIDELRNVPHADDSDRNLNYRELLDVVLLKSEQLTPMERKILIDAKVNGLDNKELENRHGLRPQRVRNLLSSALAKIRQLLRR